jgi:hypothetical protein
MDQNKIDNKSFINWCLLCAISENVTLEINELNDEIKENIGMFSVLVRIQFKDFKEYLLILIFLEF